MTDARAIVSALLDAENAHDFVRRRRAARVPGIEEVQFRCVTYPEPTPLDDLDDGFGDDPEATGQVQYMLAGGSAWAWCQVVVEASWLGVTGHSGVMRCIFAADEDDFKARHDDVYEHMEGQAYADLCRKLEEGKNNG